MLFLQPTGHSLHSFPFHHPPTAALNTTHETPRKESRQWVEARYTETSHNTTQPNECWKIVKNKSTIDLNLIWLYFLSAKKMSVNYLFIIFQLVRWASVRCDLRNKSLSKWNLRILPARFSINVWCESKWMPSASLKRFPFESLWPHKAARWRWRSSSSGMISLNGRQHSIHWFTSKSETASSICGRADGQGINVPSTKLSSIGRLPRSHRFIITRPRRCAKVRNRNKNKRQFTQLNSRYSENHIQLKTFHLSRWFSLEKYKIIKNKLK